MKITADQLFEDMKVCVSNRDNTLPIFGYSFNYDESVRVINTRFGDMAPEDLAGIVNFYLDRCFKNNPEGEVTVTTNEAGECVLVSRQDEDHKILKVIWEKK